MTSQAALPITGIDTHAHIFRQDLPMAGNRRYSPAYDATVEQYLMHLDRQGLSHGVLVQPSFLGTDNSFMVEALRRFPARLRGTAVVDRDVSEQELDSLGDAGVVAIRLNLVGRELEDYSASAWQGFFAKLARRGWSVEIQRSMDDLARIVPAMLDAGIDVIIDHFGLPGGEIDPQAPAHRDFLSLFASGRLWIKLSATYRAKLSPGAALASLEHLRQACGHSERFLWGSDWPHTQFETQIHYGQQYALLEQLLPVPGERKRVLVDNPARLFRF